MGWMDSEERLRTEEAEVAAAQRDRKRFGALYERNFDAVYAYVARRVPNRSDAEDITATAFHKALANLHRFEWRGVPFAAWLIRIAANEIADRAPRRAPSLLPLPDDSTLEQVEHRAMLFQHVRALPADQRRVLEMRFAEQWTVREIAEALGRSDGAVRQLQFRALQTLRAGLGAEDV